VKREAHIPTAEYAEKHPVLANPGETRLMQHMPQLDGVRALAVLMVIWHHFMPRSAQLGGVAPWGAIGVGLFFTLSGFLITRILLNCKLKIEADKATVGSMMKQFYVRRFLRIFPLYYAVLLVLFVVNPVNYHVNVAPEPNRPVQIVTASGFVPATYDRTVNKSTAQITLADGKTEQVERNTVQGSETFRARIWWHAAYLSNVRFSFWKKAGEIERHLWSLSVEEQFYLVWPMLILLVPRRLLLPLIVLTVVSAPAWRIVAYHFNRGYLIHEWMMPGCLDLLGMGALLALLSIPEFGLSRWWNGFTEFCGAIGVPLFFVFVTAASVAASGRIGAVSHFGIESGFERPQSGWVDLGFEFPGGATYPITALAAVWLIGAASRGFKGPLGWVLASAPLVYIGRISYGLYVIHMFVPHIINHALGWDTVPRGWTQFVTYVAIAIAAASVSWFCFEAPINRLKRYFEYDKTARTKPATSN